MERDRNGDGVVFCVIRLLGGGEGLKLFCCSGALVPFMILAAPTSLPTISLLGGPSEARGVFRRDGLLQFRFIGWKFLGGDIHSG